MAIVVVVVGKKIWCEALRRREWREVQARAPKNWRAARGPRR